MNQKREHFRLRYPLLARPRLKMSEATAIVTELSERGMRLSTVKLPALDAQSPVAGNLKLACGTLCDIRGNVIRVDGDELIVSLTEGPSYGDMVAEQRCIAQRFPNWRHPV
ncbi:MAG: PilZ domain-containing protein [Pseudomonadales bacterium]|nr:PilZ domain-containing protein [Pseudomonadales bacterium]